MTTNNSDLVLSCAQGQVRTLTMNMPRRYNGWTVEMMQALREALAAAAAAPDDKVVILTGTDPYYSAGVNLAGTIKLTHPQKLREMIVEQNRALFDAYLEFPKPILAAVNGPAIGASVTSATLCDAIIASEKATFSTPFARLGITKEGCSSVLFAKLLGERNAVRMLESEGWVPTGQEAKEIGLAGWCTPHETLLAEAQSIAESWIAQGRQRTFRGGMTKEALMAINAKESEELAGAFLNTPFLEAQYQFLRKKKKWGPAAMFFVLRHSRPLWSKLLVR